MSCEPVSAKKANASLTDRTTEDASFVFSDSETGFWTASHYFQQQNGHYANYTDEALQEAFVNFIDFYKFLETEGWLTYFTFQNLGIKNRNNFSEPDVFAKFIAIGRHDFNILQAETRLSGKNSKGRDILMPTLTHDGITLFEYNKQEARLTTYGDSDGLFHKAALKLLNTNINSLNLHKQSNVTSSLSFTQAKEVMTVVKEEALNKLNYGKISYELIDVMRYIELSNLLNKDYDFYSWLLKQKMHSHIELSLFAIELTRNHVDVGFLYACYLMKVELQTKDAMEDYLELWENAPKAWFIRIMQNL